jgi:hypothetical protein
MLRCKPERQIEKKRKIYIYIDRKIKAEKEAAAHRLRPIRLALVAIAIGDKDFIVSPPNRKTDVRALQRGRGRRKKKKKNRTEEGKSERGWRQSDQCSTDANFSARLRAYGCRKMHNPQSELKASVVSLR